MSKSASDVVFFFGAGASAPFGIPTMKQFVVDFERFLEENAEKSERDVYADIKNTLEGKLHKPVDLEAIFTVIDGVINYDDPERLGMFSLYFTTGFRKKNFPNIIDVEVCRKLRQKFQAFVKDNCVIPEESFGKLKMVYRDFFNRFAIELGGNIQSRNDSAWISDWTIFTTNYDTCLEYYWSDVVNVITGFRYDNVRKGAILDPRLFLQEHTPGAIQLLKLHGSIAWVIEEGTGAVIELMEKGKSLWGRKYKGEMMLYPIAEKELYLDPYISMLLRLKRELKKKPTWLVIGYSFNDPVIREIFLSQFNGGKKVILVHPKAREIHNRRLSRMKKVIPIEKKFGIFEEEEYKKVNHQIIHKLKDNPKFAWSDLVIP